LVVGCVSQPLYLLASNQHDLDVIFTLLTLPWLKPRGFTGGFRLYPLVSRIQTTPVELL
jgi:hypothetical protein